eukprot:82752-Rhodomonas_salina.1
MPFAPLLLRPTSPHSLTSLSSRHVLNSVTSLLLSETLLCAALSGGTALALSSVAPLSSARRHPESYP